MNAFQVCSYNVRNHDIGSDFKMIETGGGNGDMELGVFGLVSSYNLLKLDSMVYDYLQEGGRK